MGQGDRGQGNKSNWSKCVMSVLSTTKHSSCNQCIDTWQ